MEYVIIHTSKDSNKLVNFIKPICYIIIYYYS